MPRSQLFFLQNSRHKKNIDRKKMLFFHQLKNNNFSFKKLFLFVCLPFRGPDTEAGKTKSKMFFFNQHKSLQCRSFRKVFRSTGLQEIKPQSFEFSTGLFTGHIFVFFLDRPKPFFLKTQQTKKEKSHFDSAFYSKIPPHEKKFSSKLLNRVLPFWGTIFPGCPLFSHLLVDYWQLKFFHHPLSSLLFLRQPNSLSMGCIFCNFSFIRCFSEENTPPEGFFPLGWTCSHDKADKRTNSFS